MKKQKLGMHIGNAYYKPKAITIVLVCVIILGILGGLFFLFKDDIMDLTANMFKSNDPVVTAAPAIPQATKEPVSAPTATPASELVPVTPTPMIEVTVEPTPTPVPTPTPEPTPRAATIRFLGEIVVDENILSAAIQDDGTYSFMGMLSTVAGAAGNADYTVANVEGSMGGMGSGYTGKGMFNTPESLINDLKTIGVDMLALSNDHTLDAGFDGLLNTVANCDDIGMDYVGAAATQEEHDTPKIIDINGINVCFLNYTTSINVSSGDVSDEALEYGIYLAKNSNSRADAAAAREAGADVVIAIVSWGTEGETDIDSTQKKIAGILLESGVDAIIGYGPRRTQAVLWLDKPAAETADGEEPAEPGKAICAISLGTLISSSEKKSQDCGTIFEISISENEDGTFTISSPISIPTYVWALEKEDTTIEYRVLACGEWQEEQPEGMTDEDYARLVEIWTEMGEVVTEASTIEMN